MWSQLKIPLHYEEHGVQDSCMVVPISYDNSQLTVRGDPDVDEVLDDINDKGTNDDENIDASLVGNPVRCVVIRNDLGAHMSLIDLDVAHAAEFSEYPDILLTHWLVADFKPEELFVGQKFKTTEEFVIAIKRYSMNVSMDYKVVMSKLTLYIGEC
ncbi:hypothetical protein PVK06_002374 [Gossypium arboreum]|uniref:Uncharacterized protein n=1 Tax=Gossypium arboreum TaxID=29729 RepID=A0ABR0R3E5_GOSAR|nr:hypothetical protein PVK06_002374 [Gossypium arboreum]